MRAPKILLEEMALDCELAAAMIIDFIKKKVQAGDKQGVLLGLSGGVDSALVASLAVKAVGPERVDAIHIYDQDSRKKSMEYARCVAEKLGIRFKTVDMSRLPSESVVGDPPANISPLPPFINRVMIAIFHFFSLLFFGQRPFVVALKRQPPSGGLSKTLYNLIVDWVGGNFDRKHRLRRVILEDYARQKNLLLVGAANKSESMVGWFVKDGVDDLPIEPILGLYKTQVLQLARCFDVQQEIIEQHPSPDMLKGLTDEMAIGFSYDRLDAALFIIENGLGIDYARRAGINPRELDEIRTIHRLSAWKRESPHEYPSLA